MEKVELTSLELFKERTINVQKIVKLIEPAYGKKFTMPKKDNSTGAPSQSPHY